MSIIGITWLCVAALTVITAIVGIILCVLDICDLDGDGVAALVFGVCMIASAVAIVITIIVWIVEGNYTVTEEDINYKTTTVELQPIKTLYNTDDDSYYVIKGNSWLGETTQWVEETEKGLEKKGSSKYYIKYIKGGNPRVEYKEAVGWNNDTPRNLGLHYENYNYCTLYIPEDSIYFNLGD